MNAKEQLRTYFNKAKAIATRATELNAWEVSSSVWQNGVIDVLKRQDARIKQYGEEAYSMSRNETFRMDEIFATMEKRFAEVEARMVVIEEAKEIEKIAKSSALENVNITIWDTGVRSGVRIEARYQGAYVTWEGRKADFAKFINQYIDAAIENAIQANVAASAEEAAAQRETTETGVIAPSVAEILRATNAYCEDAKDWITYENPMTETEHLENLRLAYQLTADIRRIKMRQIFNYFYDTVNPAGESFYTPEELDNAWNAFNNDYRKMVEVFERKAVVIWGYDDLNFDNLPKPLEL